MDMRRYTLGIVTLLTIISFCLVGCPRKGASNQQHDEDNISLFRLEKLIFDTPAEQLQQVLQQHYSDYACQLLNVNPGDAQLMSQMVGFAQDESVREIYDSVQARFANLYWLEAELTEAMKRAEKAGIELDYQRYITFVSAMFDYDFRVAADGSTLLIAIDQYVLPCFEKYGYIGTPMYIVRLCDSAYLATDCMAAVGRNLAAFPEKEPTMLDYMIAEGKTLYFLDQVMPRKADSLKIRYTIEQMEWMKENEANVWAYFVQNKMLFDKDLNHFNNFIDEAPKTNAFRNSAPRTAQYIGWQIVRQYMQKSKVSLAELMEESNSQKILDASGYHPK